MNKSMMFLPIQYSLMPAPANETCSPMNMLVLSSSTFASWPPALAKTQDRIHILKPSNILESKIEFYGGNN